MRTCTRAFHAATFRRSRSCAYSWARVCTCIPRVHEDARKRTCRRNEYTRIYKCTRTHVLAHKHVPSCTQSRIIAASVRTHARASACALAYARARARVRAQTRTRGKFADAVAAPCA
eukprot:1523612-Pleurochrysis_carterae.AAC.1